MTVIKGYEGYDEILDMWARGAQGPEIRATLKVTDRYLRRILDCARTRGDFRAARRTREKRAELIAQESPAFAKEKMLGMDLAFKTAMLRAIKSGAETAPLGTYKPNLNSHKATPAPFVTGVIHSYCGSSAAMCSEN